MDVDIGQVVSGVTPAAPEPIGINGPSQIVSGVTLAASEQRLVNQPVFVRMQLDAADERRNLINEEARIQSEVWRLGYAEYSEYIVRSEYIIQAEVSESQFHLHEMEARIQANEGRATAAEERLLQSEAAQAHILHTERHALNYAVQANQETQLYARQRLHLAGVSVNLQAQLEMDRQ